MKKKLTILTLILCPLVLFYCGDKGSEKPDCNTNSPLLNIETTAASCGMSDGKILASVSGGSAPYLFSFNGEAFQSSSEFSNLSIGSYAVVVQDKNQCGDTVLVELKESNNLVVNTITTPAGCGTANGSITITATGESGNYTYKIEGGSFQSSGEFKGLTPGSYVINVKDAGGCSSLATAKVTSGISFSGSIKTIIDNNCATAKCHVAGGEGPIDFTKFSLIRSSADNIKRKTGDKSMPLNGSLTQEQIQQIACWVDDGAPNN